MKLDKPRTSPSDYIKFGGNKDTKSNFKTQYNIKAESQETPWVTSRFGQKDLTKRIANKRLNLNSLNFLPEGEATYDYTMFPGLGRFNPNNDYDFDIGRPATPNYPEQQPDFDPAWKEAYAFSPVIPPVDKTKNPFPRLDNLDPNGYLAELAEEGMTTEITEFPDLIAENTQASTSI